MELTIPNWIFEVMTALGAAFALGWSWLQQKMHKDHEKEINALNQNKADKPK